MGKWSSFYETNSLPTSINSAEIDFEVEIASGWQSIVGVFELRCSISDSFRIHSSLLNRYLSPKLTRSQTECLGMQTSAINASIEGLCDDIKGIISPLVFAARLQKQSPKTIVWLYIFSFELASKDTNYSFEYSIQISSYNPCLYTKSICSDVID